MNYYILPRGPDLFRIEFFDGNFWQGAVLSTEEDLDNWVFTEWGAEGSIDMTQIFKRPCSADDIIDDFCESVMRRTEDLVDSIEELIFEPETDRVLN